MKQMRTTLLEFLYWMCIFFCVLSPAHAETTQEIAQKALSSTVLLLMEDADGQLFALGSGFLIGDGMIASNYHVIEDAASGYAKLFDKETRYSIEGVVAADADHDLVLLKVSGIDSQALPLGNSDTVQVGDPIYVVGNPKGLEGTFSNGIVSGVRNKSSWRKNPNQGPNADEQTRCGPFRTGYA